MANAYEAGAAGLPCAIFRGYIGVDLPKVNSRIKRITCPFTGEELAAVPAHRPDVAVIHALRADRAGNVLLEGGIDENGNALAVAELYNTDGRAFTFTTITSNNAEESAAPFLAASLPRDGATEVSVESFVSLRFSKPLRLETISTQSVKLVGPEGTIAIKVVPAEHGRLAFITPSGSLLSGSTYTLTIAGATDGTHELVSTSVTFTTKGKRDHTPPEPRPFTGDPDWLPDVNNLRGNWKSKFETSPWQNLAPLQASPGETALAGQVLTLNGQPLADVTLRVADKTTRTDSSGRFLLASLKAGHQVLVIDGRSATRPGKVYGIFRAGIDVAENKTNVLPFTIWMPKLDMAHAVTIASPNADEIVITNPLIPGLELRLPAGTVIRDLDGHAVTQISITPIPTDRPPFPLPPGFDVPVFASIQPGGARIIPPRARLIYPNYTNERAGARINFDMPSRNIQYDTCIEDVFDQVRDHNAYDFSSKITDDILQQVMRERAR